MRQRLQLRPRVALRFHTALVFTFASVVLASWAFFGFNLAGNGDATASDRSAIPVIKKEVAGSLQESDPSIATLTAGLDNPTPVASRRYHQMRQSEYDVRSESFRAIVGSPAQGNKQLSVLRATANPAGRTINVPVTVDNDGKAVLRIFSSSGYCMSSREVNLAAGENTISCEADNLPAGAYQVVLDIQGDIRTGRFMKNW